MTESTEDKATAPKKPTKSEKKAEKLAEKAASKPPVVEAPKKVFKHKLK